MDDFIKDVRSYLIKNSNMNEQAMDIFCKAVKTFWDFGSENAVFIATNLFSGMLDADVLQCIFVRHALPKRVCYCVNVTIPRRYSVWVDVWDGSDRDEIEEAAVYKLTQEGFDCCEETDDEWISDSEIRDVTVDVHSKQPYEE